jgi:hypothetical protein
MWAAAAALRDNDLTSIRPLDVHLMDLDSAIVEREYRSIDLLVQVPAEKVVIAVELKIDASEHSGQLSRYRSAVAKDFPESDGWRQIFLFLTKRGDSPSDLDGEGWQVLPLAAIADMLERVVGRGSGHPEARMMLNAYIGMLRRNHLTDARMEDLARELWREHREVLDFLMSRRPDVASEVFAGLTENQLQIAESFSKAAGTEIVPEHTTKTYARFAVKAWDNVPGMLTGTGWKPSVRMLLFEIYRDSKGGIRCQFVLGPGDPAKRVALFDAFKAAGADVGGNWALAPKWRQFSSKALLTPKEGDSVDEQLERLISVATHFLTVHVPKYQAAVDQLTQVSAQTHSEQ